MLDRVNIHKAGPDGLNARVLKERSNKISPILALNLRMLDFFNTIWLSKSLDPDQARHFVGPDLGPNCLQRLSEDIARLGVNYFVKVINYLQLHRKLFN